MQFHHLSRSLTAFVTLVAYLGATLVPAYAAAQEDPASIDGYGRADGSSWSTTGDRSGARTTAEVAAPTESDEGNVGSQDSGMGDVDTAPVTAPGEDDSAPAKHGQVAPAEDEEAGTPADQPLPQQAVADPSGADKSGVTGQTISIPKGAGSIQGMGESFSAQLSTGIATFSVPFALPAARGAAQPALGLSYSSADGAGPAGQGWSVGVPFIARQTDRGLPKYQDQTSWHPEQDRFVFNGGQELVPICRVSAGTCSGALEGEVMPSWASGYQYFRARVEGSFLRFFWAPDHQSWIVQDKNGTILELGQVAESGPAPGGLHLAGANALERNPERPGEIYRWHLSRQYDQHVVSGVPYNLVVYDYDQVEGQAYLTDIFDTSPAGEPTSTQAGAFAHHTRLVWEARPDRTESYRSGWLMASTRRLRRVDVAAKTFQGGSAGARKQVRRYHLEYDQELHRSVLMSVQIEGRCGASEDDAATPSEAGSSLPAGTSCGRLPAMRFDYSRGLGYQPDGSADSSHLPGYLPFDGRPKLLASSPNHSIDEGLTDFFDINSDGLPDVLVTAPGLYGKDHALFLNGQGGSLGFGAPQNMSVQGVLGADASSIKLSNPNVTPFDLDGDGRINLVHVPSFKKYGIYDPQEVGGKWSWIGRTIETATAQNIKIDFGSDTLDTQVMDVDFDGLVDVSVSTGTEIQTFFSLGRYPGGDGQFGAATRTGAASASISLDPVTTCVPHSGLPVRFGDGETRLADMNGDGITDIVSLRRGNIRYWPGRGNGFWGTGPRDDCAAGTFAANRHLMMEDAPNYSDIEGSTVRLDDVDGDGLPDLVQIRYDAVDIWLNVDGRGFTDRHILDGTPRHAGFHNRVRLVDVDGSGTVDVLYGDAKAYKYIDLFGGKKPYLLTSVQNGLGKTTSIEYSTAAQEMLAAAATGNACGAAPPSDRFAAAWCKTAPVVSHVVKRVTERDNITIRGRPPAEYVTEYQYRDPIYEGRQREFRGFSRARARRLGDVNSPTDLSESVFLLGECLDPADGSAWNGVDQTHYCAPPNRWADNPYEALKGLPVETHRMDAVGVHLASTENEYTIRTLYEGLDGRAVRHAFLSQTDSLLYDAGARSPGRTEITRRGFLDQGVVGVDGAPGGLGAPFNPIGEPSAPSAYASGMAQVRVTSEVDAFGNQTESTKHGCVGGSECPQQFDLPADEAITQVTAPTLIEHVGGWLWRTAISYVSGSVHAEARRRTLTTYDAHGRPSKVEALLTGAASGGQVRREGGAWAPAPISDGLFTQSTVTYDAFGNALRTRGAGGRCAELKYDDATSDGYGLFATVETISTGDTGSVDDASVPCSGPLLTSSAAYDHAHGVVTLATDLNLRNTLAVYDEFGRVTALHKPSAMLPSTELNHQVAPSVLIEYFLPDVLGGAHSIIHTRTQDGDSEGDTGHYLESYAYVDGFGRTLVTLGEADPGAHDAGEWIAGTLLEWDQKSAVERKYMPFFWNGNPLAFDYGSQPTTPYGRQRYDAFGRQLQTYDLDGTVTLQSQHHALTTDLWDAADLMPGPHQGSYASERRDGHGRSVQTTERFRAYGGLEERHVQSSYLPTGEPLAIARVRGSESVVRWMRYDSLGRLILNVEPNTSTNYTPDAGTLNASAIEAWRYQYNLAGDLVATSDARGCGQNYFYDGAGRILGEDYAPCEDHHAPYTQPSSGTDVEDLEVSYFYDQAGSVPGSVAPAGWTGSTAGGPFTTGRAIAVLDRGRASFTTYDGRGRPTVAHSRVAKPRALNGAGQPETLALADRYAPRVYERSIEYDAADREVSAGTGVEALRDQSNTPVTELLSPEGQSRMTTVYSARGAVKAASSSYGSLISDITRTADSLVTELVYGDAAETRTAYLYDERRRISSVQTYRGPPASGAWETDSSTQSAEPTRQLLLQDEDFQYDVVGNPVEIRDWRNPDEWPSGAQPVTKKIDYDDLYRAVRVRYNYPSGDDTWKSPHAADIDANAANDDPRRAKPSPHVEFERRMLEQSFRYDWLGNSAESKDDAAGFYDRSLGTVTNGAAPGGSDPKPYQLRTASLSGGRGGSLEARYDAAGYMTKLGLLRDGPCLGGSASSCDQHFRYDWDEVGRLARARRWDSVTQSVDSFSPSETPAADLRHSYDAADQRVLKQAVDGSGVSSHTVYLFGSLELRRTQFGAGYATNGSSEDYEISHFTVAPYLTVNGVRIGRLVYHATGVPELATSSEGGPGDVNASSGELHVFFELGDHLGSTSVVLDKASGELVERATFQAYGGAESDYRPDRWKSFREDYRFTGKEEDVEVGLQYFGKRYLNPLLGRWISADPLAAHVPGKADFNLYAYVSGSVLKNVDPLGLDKYATDTPEVSADGAEIEMPMDGINSTAVEDNSYSGGGESYLADPGPVGGAPSTGGGGAGGTGDADPTPGATGASGVDDGATGSFECTGFACTTLMLSLTIASELAKGLTSLPTGDSPCATAADCQARSEAADAQSVLVPFAYAGLMRFVPRTRGVPAPTGGGAPAPDATPPVVEATKSPGTAIQPYYPPNRGFSGAPASTTLEVGTRIDRYGSEMGNFAAPQGTPFEMRSLPNEAASAPLTGYEVVRPLPAAAGTSSPWFGQIGGGVQFEFSQSMDTLVQQGYLRRLP